MRAELWGRWNPVNVIIMLLQTSDDGNTTTSVLSFMATKEDAGRHLSCQAENRIMGTAPIEDDWVLQIQCKLINDERRAQRVSRLSFSPGRERSFLIYSDAGNPVDFDGLSKVVIRRHAGDADPPRHVAESEQHTRGHGRLLRLPHPGRTDGLQGGVASPGESETSELLFGT